MPIPLGILAAAGIRPAVAAGAYDLLESVVLTGTATNITFSNLSTSYSSTYQHLQIRWTGRTNRAGQPIDRLLLRFNGDSGNNVFTHSMFGNGSSVVSGSGWGTIESRVLFESALTGATATSGAFGSGVIDILDPFESKNKTIRSLYGNQIDNRVSLTSAAYFSTNTLTTLDFTCLSSFIQGTRFSLYGLKASA